MFLGGNYCPNKARSYHLDFLFNLIKIISSDAKNNIHNKRNLLFFQYPHIVLIAYLKNLNRNRINNLVLGSEINLQHSGCAQILVPDGPPLSHTGPAAQAKSLTAPCLARGCWSPSPRASCQGYSRCRRAFRMRSVSCSLSKCQLVFIVTVITKTQETHWCALTLAYVYLCVCVLRQSVYTLTYFIHTYMCGERVPDTQFISFQFACENDFMPLLQLTF